MNGFADTGFIASVYLEETTTEAAESLLRRRREPLPIIPLTVLEFRNALNLAIARGRIALHERDEVWERFQMHLATGTFIQVPISATELYEKARELSDRHTPALATRSLDLLHVAAAVLLKTKVFYSFDERQRKAARAEGMTVKP